MTPPTTVRIPLYRIHLWVSPPPDLEDGSAAEPWLYLPPVFLTPSPEPYVQFLLFEPIN